ncbi:MAG TPA: hypothetical protein ENK19_00355, partial [Acidobacteria bacterium]|nr:hypothetical protein [Acidobacteriota bacterium]
MRRALLVLALCCVAAAAIAAEPGAPGRTGELEAIRAKITRLERRVGDLGRRTEDARQREERLRAQLELAKARVQELEMLLAGSREEILKLRRRAVELSGELARRRELLKGYVSMAALLGDLGSAQLFFDALRGGHLAEASGTVAVLVKGQVRLTEEYADLEKGYRKRLGELSNVLNRAQQEAVELGRRRKELEQLQLAALHQRKKLEHQKSAA